MCITQGTRVSCQCGNVQLESGDFLITELPLRKWTQDYKEFLEGLVKPEKKDDAPLVLDYKCASVPLILPLARQLATWISGHDCWDLAGGEKGLPLGTLLLQGGHKAPTRMHMWHM